MTIPAGSMPSDQTECHPRNSSKLGLNDPLLQELWAAKAAFNAAADYQVGQLATQAASFDLDEALARLGENAVH